MLSPPFLKKTERPCPHYHSRPPRCAYFHHGAARHGGVWESSCRSSKLIFRLRKRRPARRALTIASFGTVWARMHLVFSPLLGALVGSLSGRRPWHPLSNIGLGLDYIIMSLAPKVSAAGGEQAGGGGEFGPCAVVHYLASLEASNAYVSDVTPRKTSSACLWFAMGSAFGIGFILGPRSAAGLGGHVDPRLPFWFRRAASLLSLLRLAGAAGISCRRKSA